MTHLKIRDQCFKRFRVHLLAAKEKEQAGLTLTESLQISEHMARTLIINTVNGLVCNKTYLSIRLIKSLII